MLTIFDIAGLFGVTIILSAYIALQLGKITAEDWRYSAANAIGAALILISLYFDFNLSAALIEFAWLLISLFGLFKAWPSRH